MRTTSERRQCADLRIDLIQFQQEDRSAPQGRRASRTGLVSPGRYAPPNRHFLGGVGAALTSAMLRRRSVLLARVR